MGGGRNSGSELVTYRRAYAALFTQIAEVQTGIGRYISFIGQIVSIQPHIHALQVDVTLKV